jgi:hypothetical protein
MPSNCFGYFAAADAHHDAASAPVPDSLELAEAFASEVGLSVPQPTMPASVTRTVAVMSPELEVTFTVAGSPTRRRFTVTDPLTGRTMHPLPIASVCAKRASVNRFRL